jgi:peptide/nickel transport system substrate-binding protein
LKRLLAASFALLLLATACTKVSQTGEAGGRANSFTQPHVLRFADAGDVNTLNPHLGQYADVGFISQMTMAWLIKWDEHNQPYPELATEVPTQSNGGVSKDGLTITYHLRRGVKWADGAPFDADDVVFSTKVVLNPANNEVGRQGWDLITKIDEPDKYTVVYHLKKPYSPFVEVFFSTAGANPCILPKHLLAQYPNINNVPYNEKPVGIGPFKVDRWDRTQDVILVANPLYWRGRPKLDKIIFKIIPDRNTMVSELQTHDVDMWHLVPGAYLSRVQSIPGLSMLRQPSYYWNHLDFNLLRPALKDPVVRQALRYGTDRAELRHKIGRDVGILSDVPTPVSAPYYVSGYPVTPFDLAKANDLLDKDGWVRGADGIRSKNGVRLVLDVATNTGSTDTDNMIELIRANWQKLGVGLSVRHYPVALMFAPLQQGGIVYSNKWDVIFFAWQNEAIGDYSQIYGCDAFPPKGQNDPRWCSPAAQAAMNSLYRHYEQPQRNQDVKALVKEFVKDVPVIVTSEREDIYAYNTDLKNFHPNGVSPFDNMMDVDI